jgi:hypothetical protein
MRRMNEDLVTIQCFVYKWRDPPSVDLEVEKMYRVHYFLQLSRNVCLRHRL